MIDVVRFFCAFSTGFIIALSGTLTQVITHNPLASPSTLGITSLGVFITLGVSTVLALGLPGQDLSWFGTIVTGLLTLFLLTKKIAPVRTFGHTGNTLTQKVIIRGLAANLLAGSLFALVHFFFMIYAWEFPSHLWFPHFKFTQELQGVVFLGASVYAFYFVRRHYQGYELLLWGPQVALARGVHVTKLTSKTLILIIALTCLVIVHFGVFVFLGLLLPHLLRQISFFKYHLKRQLFAGSFLSGLFLAGLDWGCYFFPLDGVELPVGLVTSCCGGIVLFFLTMRRGNTC